MADKKFYFLKNYIPWFGNHTGYEQLIRYIDKDVSHSVIDPPRTILNRMSGKAVSLLKGWPVRNQHESYKEFVLALKLQLHQSACGHVMYLENHLPYFSFSKKLNERTFATIHQPPSFWKPDDLDQLYLVKRAIILYEKDMEFFSKYIPDIHFIHHGADIDFFKPDASYNHTSDGPMRLLLAGHHLRNIPMFHRVAEKILALRKDVVIDILVPERFRDNVHFEALKTNPSVFWHQKLSDEELRKLFQQSYLLLVPMNDSGANTAIIDSLACGLPIVTTNVGGIGNYGGGAVYPLVENDNDVDMISLLLHYLDNPAERNRISVACRDFAVQTLNWKSIAEKHIAVFNKTL